MISISHIPEEGQLKCQKCSLHKFLLIVNNVNRCNSKNAPDLMVAVYCYCLVQLKIEFGPPYFLL